MRKDRISLDDNLATIIMKLSEGNIGAVSGKIRCNRPACCEMVKVGPECDPDSAWGGFGPLLALDSHGIYGPKIWMLFKDLCGQRAGYVIAILRACQLGIISECNLLRAIDSPASLNVVETVALVLEKLPRFQLEPTLAALADSTGTGQVSAANSEGNK